MPDFYDEWEGDSKFVLNYGGIQSEYTFSLLVVVEMSN